MSSIASMPFLPDLALALDSASAFLSPVGGTFLILSLSPAGLPFSFSTSLARANGRLTASDGAAAFLGTIFLILSIVSISDSVFFIPTAPPALYLRTFPPSFLARPPLRSLLKSVFSPSCSWLSCMPNADLTTFLAVFSSCLASARPPSLYLPPAHMTLVVPPLFITLTLPPSLKCCILGSVLNPSIINPIGYF